MASTNLSDLTLIIVATEESKQIEKKCRGLFELAPEYNAEYDRLKKMLSSPHNKSLEDKVELLKGWNPKYLAKALFEFHKFAEPRHVFKKLAIHIQALSDLKKKELTEFVICYAHKIAPLSIPMAFNRVVGLNDQDMASLKRDDHTLNILECLSKILMNLGDTAYIDQWMKGAIYILSTLSTQNDYKKDIVDAAKALLPNPVDTSWKLNVHNYNILLGQRDSQIKCDFEIKYDDEKTAKDLQKLILNYDLKSNPVVGTCKEVIFDILRSWEFLKYINENPNPVSKSSKSSPLLVFYQFVSTFISYKENKMIDQAIKDAITANTLPHEFECDLKDLDANVKLYLGKGKGDHSGTISMHMKWTEATVANWLFHKNKKALKLHHLADLVKLCAKYHDIGKTGDNKGLLATDTIIKDEHPNTGYEYAKNKKMYFWVNDKEFNDLSEYLKDNCKDVGNSIFALVSKMHYDLGVKVMRNYNSSDYDKHIEAWNILFKTTCDDLGIPESKWADLARICLVVSMADVWGFNDPANMEFAEAVTDKTQPKYQYGSAWQNFKSEDRWSKSCKDILAKYYDNETLDFIFE